MTEPPGIRAALLAAQHEVNWAFAHLPTDAQERIDVATDDLEAEVDAAILADDRERAEAAIRAWRDYWHAEFERVAR
jgi:hypothetical protein